ncbi:putative DNA mismatch repair protein [Aspergillus novofumigatus IBT 16806]|uniref:Putative DNA mismatch repair protein n=1 Tax=Aspergillus novofumigatus (strain IBT 16806) TaxID=1392255 RepID=A0A2I1C0B7_ASPN1|nr:putative DNA mismatch repair protein [Aspergillus novofumigatus IBT 16806]PKX91092.1 putative DNA mismatch repair protein [Aspergillus novofumigatus IBT 16806]
MPIAALPQTTVRAIGSTSVISDPCSIVKELLENSLDAHATAIFIEISQNTVDVIQVKDNGHGIPSEDHPFVCRRAFTSKIETVDDLRKLGGKSLGFRGEALASAAEVCGGVTVTTRVKADPVGFCMKYGRNGELISTQHASHPVGTTVRVTDLFKNIPVRRQTVLKSSAKTIAKIKKIIQSYAIAQPSIRLSLKVLKAASEKANWVYAPGKNASLVDAALKVAGTEVASACVTKQWPYGNESDEESGCGNGSSFELMALLANPESDFSKVNNAGQFFSVDGRPLSASRGIGQEISKLYKSYLRAAATRSGGFSNISDPFLCLQIRCPEACYDVNVEPAKDDVLFENQQDVLSLAEALFQDLYGETPDGVEKRKSPSKGKERMTNNDAFELLLARKDTTECSVETVNEGNNPPSFVTASSLFHMRSSPKNGRHEQRLFSDGSPGASGHTRTRDSEGLNPWSVTRLYAPSGAPSHKTPSRGPTGSARLPPAAQEQHSMSTTHASPLGSASSASPRASTPNSNRLSHSPAESRSSASVSELTQTSPITPVHGSSVRSRASRQRDKERYGNGALDTWFVKTAQASARREPVEQRPENEHDEPPLSQLAQDRFAQRERPPVTSDTTAPRGFPVASGSPGPSEEETSSLESSLISRSRASEPASRRLDRWSAHLHRLANADENPDLERALDFEKRKREAITRLREQRKNASAANSPHVSRYLAAKAALQPDINSSNAESERSLSETDNPSPRLDPHDPRSYLMRNKSSHDQRRLASDPAKIRRVQTKKLPFEKIAEGCELHDLCLVQPAAIPLVSKTLRTLYEQDLYIREEDTFAGFTAADLQFLSLWESQLSSLIKQQFRTTEGSDMPSIQINFSDLQHLGDFDMGGASASA